MWGRKSQPLKLLDLEQHPVLKSKPRILLCNGLTVFCILDLLSQPIIKLFLTEELDEDRYLGMYVGSDYELPVGTVPGVFVVKPHHVAGTDETSLEAAHNVATYKASKSDDLPEGLISGQSSSPQSPSGED